MPRSAAAAAVSLSLCYWIQPYKSVKATSLRIVLLLLRQQKKEKELQKLRKIVHQKLDLGAEEQCSSSSGGLIDFSPFPKKERIEEGEITSSNWLGKLHFLTHFFVSFCQGSSLLNIQSVDAEEVEVEEVELLLM